MPDWECARRMLSSLQQLRDGGRADVRIIHDRADETPTSALRELLFSVRGGRRACTVEYDLAGNHTPLGLRSSWRSPLRRQPSEWGYQHMIRFFFADLFLDGVLPTRYRYWLRIDSDAMLWQPVANPSPFLDARPEVGYLHHEPTVDCGDVVRGLPAFADAWAPHARRGGGVGTAARPHAAHAPSWTEAPTAAASACWGGTQRRGGTAVGVPHRWDGRISQGGAVIGRHLRASMGRRAAAAAVAGVERRADPGAAAQPDWRLLPFVW